MRFVDRVMFRRLLLLICIALSVCISHAQSVLATGNWYKVGITQSGIYKLDRAYLSSLGLPVSSLDPRTLKVYGNGGGGILPQLNATPRPFDLQQNAILEVGNDDGSFDTNDYFLFYGQSPDQLEWSGTGFSYEKNIYSDTTYYFITFGGAHGERVPTVASEVEQPQKITTFDDVLIHETDQTNILSSGRRWFGEVLSSATGLSTSFTLSSNNVLSLHQARLVAAAQSAGASSMQLTVNGQLVGTLPISARPGGIYSSQATAASGSYLLTGAVNTIPISITFQPSGSPSIGYVDWVSVQVTRALTISDNQVHFRSMASLENEVSSFQLGNAPADLTIWDVTNPLAPKRMSHSTSGGSAIFSTNTSSLKEFVAFSGSTFPTPVAMGAIPNQSIKSNTTVDGIIISHPLFLEQAYRLAAFHSSHSGLAISVVTTRQVYNEFSSGRQDVSALRDFAKYVFDTGGQLKYLLLFGDAFFDYKNRQSVDNNFVPIYQAYESFHPIYSYSSDDYFGFLEDNEGIWIENSAGDHTMEIGVGRIPTRTVQEARIVVDKIIRYSSSAATLGPWRNRVIYVADDGDGNIHMQHGETLSDMVNDGTGLNTRKLYLDAFDQDIPNPTTERSPALSREIIKAIEEGVLLVNYIGHGNEQLWMQEEVFTSSEIFRLRNFQKLPIFVTATCQFGRYDDLGNSGAENLLVREQGAIALLTTTRLVFAHTNFFLNQAFHASLVNASSDPTRRLGDILRDTKNNGLQGAVNRNFALLGDPMMRPGFPQFNISIDQLQQSQTTTLSALSPVTLTGSIRQNDALVSDFNGKIHVTLFDVPVQKITNGQENVPLVYSEQDNALFRGEASVNNGAFSISFILPKNISYRNLQGRLSMYAWDEQNAKDAGTMSQNFLIGGTNKEAPADNKAPTLEVYLNEPSFKNGGTVGPGAVLIAQFEDESGMNMSNSGFDRGITLDLNGELIELNEYYTAQLDNFTKGVVVYPLNDLAPGQYTARIKGSDVYNNPVSESVDFVVSNQPILQTFNLKTYPNPARTEVNFSFDHDREGESLALELVLYSMNGERIIVDKTLVPFSSRTVVYTSDFTGHVPKDGVYIYKLSIRSTADMALKELTGRLFIGN